MKPEADVPRRPPAPGGSASAVAGAAGRAGASVLDRAGSSGVVCNGGAGGKKMEGGLYPAIGGEGGGRGGRGEAYDDDVESIAGLQELGGRWAGVPLQGLQGLGPAVVSPFGASAASEGEWGEDEEDEEEEEEEEPYHVRHGCWANRVWLLGLLVFALVFHLALHHVLCAI